MQCSNGAISIPLYFQPFSLRSRRHFEANRREGLENIRELSKAIGTGVAAGVRKIGSATHSVDLKTGFKVLLFGSLFFALCAAAAASAAQPNASGNTTIYDAYKVEIKEPPAPAFYEKTPPLRTELPNRHKNEPDGIYRCVDDACEKVESIALPPSPATSSKHTMAWHVAKITEDSTVSFNQAPISQEIRNEIQALLLAAENLQNKQLFNGINNLVNRLDVLPLIKLIEHCWMIVNENLYEGAYSAPQKIAAIQSWRDLSNTAQFYRVANVMKIPPESPNDPVHLTVTQAINSAYRCDFDAAKRAYKSLDIHNVPVAIKYNTAAHIVNLAHMRFNIPMPTFDPHRPNEINEWNTKAKPYNRLINFFKREEDRLLPELMKQTKRNK
ncbi:MAG: hypothetical protein LLG04_04675 [Parachlamydia sp.]|nr:hypothetical protein [Parachlamydia sp.]